MYIEEIIPFKNPKYLDIKVVSKIIVDTIKEYDESNIVEGVYLFGSRTKRTATKESDLDIGVFLNLQSGIDSKINSCEVREEITSKLEDVIGYKIDFIIVFLKHGNPGLEFDIASGLELYATHDFKEEVFEFRLNKILNNIYS